MAATKSSEWKQLVQNGSWTVDYEYSGGTRKAAYLGDGSFGEVFKVVAKSALSSAPRALKVIEKSKLLNPKDEAAMVDECLLLMRTGAHDNVVQLFNVYNEGDKRRGSYAMVMDRAANSRGPGGPTGPLGTPSRTPWILFIPGSAIGNTPALVPGPLARL